VNSPDDALKPHRPLLTPSFPLPSKETVRVVSSAESPAPNLGWHARGYVPHWDQPGMIKSLNFRLADSMPQSVLQRWRAYLGLLPGSAGTPATEAERKAATEFRRRVEEYLDAGHGECLLRRPEIAVLVENALLHFDRQRYLLLAWCVMPNHVHALIETAEGWPLDDVLHSWKSFTSHEANKILQRRGEMWQREYLDRYIRNAEHFEAVVKYIEENPVKAGLVRIKTDWPWSSARFCAGNADLPMTSS
jgi:REP element-mobilizing transposase RayT